MDGSACYPASTEMLSTKMLDNTDSLTINFSPLDQTQEDGALFLESLHENSYTKRAGECSG